MAAISMLLSESVVKNLVDEASAVKNQALSQQTDNAPELGPPRPAIARLQALARGVLVRQGYYSPSYSRFPDALPSAVRVSTFVSSGGHVTVQLKIMMQTAVKDDVPEYSSPSTATAPPTMKGDHARREKPQKDQAAKEAVRQGIVIAVGMVVGLLAVVIMKNPARARAAACGAAAAVASLICKTKIRA